MTAMTQKFIYKSGGKEHEDSLDFPILNGSMFGRWLSRKYTEEEIDNILFCEFCSLVCDFYNDTLRPPELARVFVKCVFDQVVE